MREENHKMQLTAKLNKRERRAKELLEHYQVCERLASALGMKNPDGKRISVALFKAERRGQQHGERVCNDPHYLIADQNKELATIQTMVRKALGVLPPGFFVNSDPRGYALKIDGDNAQGKALIDAVGLPTDMGGFGLLSPTIDGDR